MEKSKSSGANPAPGAPALEKQLSGAFLCHGNLLIACMKIVTYNDHRSAPFFRALVV